jgi:hypothetical protein
MNWNGQAYSTDKYLRYMCKNLFRFGSPAGSEPNYESKEGDKCWYRLNPVGYDEEMTGTADTTGSEGSRAVTYYTDNAGFFWAKP